MGIVQAVELPLRIDIEKILSLRVVLGFAHKPAARLRHVADSRRTSHTAISWNARNAMPRTASYKHLEQFCYFFKKKKKRVINYDSFTDQTLKNPKFKKKHLI